eukprot:scaffold312944_cov33-Tisochrysis_lutea.AAC.3
MARRPPILTAHPSRARPPGSSRGPQPQLPGHRHEGGERLARAIVSAERLACTRVASPKVQPDHERAQPVRRRAMSQVGPAERLLDTRHLGAHSVRRPHQPREQHRHCIEVAGALHGLDERLGRGRRALTEHMGRRHLEESAAQHLGRQP